MLALKYAIQNTHILALSSEKKNCLRSFNQLNLLILRKSVEHWDYVMVKIHSGKRSGTQCENLIKRTGDFIPVRLREQKHPWDVLIEHWDLCQKQRHWLDMASCDGKIQKDICGVCTRDVVPIILFTLDTDQKGKNVEKNKNKVTAL